MTCRSGALCIPSFESIARRCWETCMPKTEHVARHAVRAGLLAAVVMTIGMILGYLVIFLFLSGIFASTSWAGRRWSDRKLARERD